MNTATVITAESLNSLSRKALIAVALEHGIEKPYTTKSVALVASILAAQPDAVEAPGADVLPAVEDAHADGDNVVAFEPSVEQTEIPAEPAPAFSRGIFKVNRKSFQRQLAAAARIASASNTMPILSCVLIDFADGVLAIEANDLSNHLRIEAQAETTEACRIAIPHRVLSKFVSRCGSEFLMAEVFGEKLVISDLENRTEIMGIPASEFPPAHSAVDVPVMEIAGKQLARVVTETIPAASTDETRYILNGLGIDTAAGFVVATDGRRLVRTVLGAENVVPMQSVAILPTHAALVLAAGVPQDVPVVVTTSFSGNHLRFKTEAVGFSYSLTSRLVEGNYPVYKQVIPDSSGCTFDAPNPELQSALGRLLVVANASGSGSAVKLDFLAESLVLKAVNVSVGQGEESVVIRAGDKVEPRHLALNGDYLNEIIASWADERLAITVKDEVSPMVIKTEDKLAIIMPVRIS